MKMNVNMGRAGGPATLFIKPDKIALCILEIFQKILLPEPPSLAVKMIRMTFEEVKELVLAKSGLEPDEKSDVNEEIFKACKIVVDQFAHQFQFTLCQKTQVQNRFIAEIGLKYTAVRIS